MDTVETVEITEAVKPEAVKTKEKITPKDAFKEMITGLLDLASGQKTPEEIRADFPKWMLVLDRYLFEKEKKRDEKIPFEYNLSEVPELEVLENFARNRTPFSVSFKGGGGTTRLLFRKNPGATNSFSLGVTNPQNENKKKEVFGELATLAKEIFSQNTTIEVKTFEDQIAFQR